MTVSRQSSTIEERLSAALRVLAETQVPDTPRASETGSSSPKRWRLMVAAAVVVVAGVVGVLLVSSNRTTDTDQLAEVDTSNQASSASPSQPIPTVTSAPFPPSDKPYGVETIGILDSTAGFGPAQTLGEVDRWLRGGVASERFAVRGSDTESPVVLSWVVLPSTEWSKTYADQPDVELANGLVAKRLVPVFVDRVNYAIETDAGVFSASIDTESEAELAQWFSTVADLNFLDITAPPGFEAVPDVNGTMPVLYDQAALETIAFDGTITLDEYIDTRAAAYTFQPAGDQGALIGTPPENDGRDPTVIWQPQPDLIVTATGSADSITQIAEALSISNAAAADLDVMSSQINPNLTGTPDLTVLDETREGRFAYTEATQPDGSVCRSFVHFAYGGDSDCSNAPSPRPICTSGWSAPDDATASIFVISDVEPDIEFTLDGQLLNPTIETDIANGVQWFLAHAHAPNRTSTDPPITTRVNQTRC